jgi:hypothetical protein
MSSQGTATEAPPESAFCILWSGRFAGAALEEGYRQHHLPRDCVRARLVLSVALAPLLIFTMSDYRLFGATAAFAALLAGRVAFALFTLAVLAAVRRTTTARSFDRLSLGWNLVAAVLNIALCAIRPPEYTGYLNFEVGYVLLLYTVAPAPLLYQMLPAGVLCVGSGAVFLTTQARTDGLTGTALAVTYLIVNVLGSVSSWELHHWKRRQFVELHQEAALRQPGTGAGGNQDTPRVARHLRPL